MSSPLRFDQLNPARKNLIRRNLRLLESKGASEAEIEAYLRDDEGLAPAPEPTPKRGVVEDMARSAMGAIANTGPSIVSMVPAAVAGLGEALGMPESARKLRGAKDAIVQAGERASEGWNPGGSQTTPGRVAGVAAGLGTGIAAMGALPGAAALGAGAAVADPDYSVGRTAQAIRGERAKALDPNLLDTVVDNPLGRAGLEALTSLGLSGAIRAGAGVVSKAKQARAAKAMVGEPREPAAQVRGLLPAMGQPAYETGPASGEWHGPIGAPPPPPPLVSPASGLDTPKPRSVRNTGAIVEEAKVAAERAGTRARLEKRPDPTSTARLEEAAKTYRQALEQGGIVRPRSGLAAREVVTTVGSAAAGAGVGGTQGETPEDRRENMILGALAGAAVGVGLSRAQRRAALRDAARQRVQEVVKNVPYASTQEGVVPGQVGLGGAKDPTVGDYMNAHVARPKSTMREIETLAKAIDVPATALDLPYLRTLVPEQVVALADDVVRRRQDLARLNATIDQIADPKARAAAELQYSKDLMDAVAIESGLSKGVGELGRGLRAWQAMAGRIAKDQIKSGIGTEAQAMRLARGILGADAVDGNPKLQAEIRRIFSGGDGPIPNSAEAFANAIRRAKVASPSELFIDIGKTSVLSLVSIMKNITSNAWNVGPNQYLADPASSAIAGLIYRFGKGIGAQGKYGFPSERQALSSATIRRAARRGFGFGAEQAFGISAAKQAFAGEMSGASGFGKIGAAARGAKKASGESWRRVTSGVSPDDPMAALERPYINYEGSLPSGTPAFLTKALQFMHDANYGMLDATDQPFFRSVEFRTVQELAELKASSRYTKGTPAWQSAVQDMTARDGATWAATVPKEHIMAALEEAAAETYKSRNRLTRAAATIANVPGFNIQMRFSQTPTNVIVQTMRTMPGVGVLVDIASEWNARKGLQKILPTDRHMMKTLGRQAGPGAVAFGLGMWGYRHGFLTGPYSEDPADANYRERLEQSGKRPNAVSFDGETWHDLGAMGPFGVILNMGAATAMAYDQAVAGGSSRMDAASTVGVAAPLHAAGQQFLDMPMVSGIKDLYDQVGGVTNEGVGERTRTLLGKAVGSYLPFNAYLAGAARALDPEDARSAKGFTAGISDRIPFLRETLPSRPTALGQVPPNTQGWKVFVDPTATRKTLQSPTVEVLDALGYGVRKPQKAKGEADADYQARVEVEGRYIHDRLLDALDRNADLADAQTSVQREQAISKSITALRQQVAEAVAGEDLLVIKRALNAGEIPDADRTEVERLYLKELGARYRAALATLRTPPPPQ